MEKRVDRNKELYKEIERDIANIQKKSDNSSFNNTNQTLSYINPDLFDSSLKSTKQDSKKSNIFAKYKIHLITASIFLVLIIIIIVLAVVLNGK